MKLTFMFLDKYRDFGLLLLRVGIGLVFIIAHGGPKMLAGPKMWEGLGEAMANVGVEFLPVVWGFLAAFAESVGALLVALGLFTRPALVLLTLTMAMAALSHITAGDAIGTVSHSLKMGIVFLSLIFIGPGRYSLDHKLS